MATLAAAALIDTRPGACLYLERPTRMPVPPLLPPARDESERWSRIDRADFGEKRYWYIVFFGGWLVLAAFGILILVGLPGSGLVLVPIGVGMILGSAIQL